MWEIFSSLVGFMCFGTVCHANDWIVVFVCVENRAVFFSGEVASFFQILDNFSIGRYLEQKQARLCDIEPVVNMVAEEM